MPDMEKTEQSKTISDLRATAKGPAPKRRKLPRWIMVVLVLAGVSVAGLVGFTLLMGGHYVRGGGWSTMDLFCAGYEKWEGPGYIKLSTGETGAASGTKFFGRELARSQPAGMTSGLGEGMWVQAAIDAGDRVTCYGLIIPLP